MTLSTFWSSVRSNAVTCITSVRAALCCRGLCLLGAQTWQLWRLSLRCKER